MDKKEIKRIALENYDNDQAKFEEFKKSIADLADSEQKEKIKEYKKNYKSERKEAKKAYKQIEDKKEKKAKKKEYKYYKKRQKRTSRYVRNSIIGVLVLLLIVNIAPMVSDISKLLDVKLNIDEEAAEIAKANGEEVALKVSDEGLVLLENKDNFLPIEDEKVNIFGFNSINFKYGGAGSGATDTSEAMSIYEGLSNAGIEYNTELETLYMDNIDLVGKDSSNIWVGMAKGLLGGDDESYDESELLTDDVIDQAVDYSDTAMYIVQSSAAEASDLTVENLQLSETDKTILDTLDSNFENVIILVNSGNTLQLDWVEDYDSIKSVLWVGTPGAQGASSIGRTLSGELNPSGNLTDTYVYDLTMHPSIENMGDYEYTNLEGMHTLEYEEGIYVGYRYFETRFGADEDTYNEVVQYPFGYGLSYTDFTQEIQNESVEDGVVSIDVKVTNTGDVAGKEIVQTYFSAPYIEGGLEKSSIELGDFNKTDMLEPGESEVVNVTFDVRDMSSYDTESGSYILDAGEYEIYISENVHNHYDSFTYDVPNTIAYTTDDETGAEIENQFDYANGDLTYMSRSDFEGTYPSDEDVNLELSQENIDMYNYREEDDTDGEEPTMGADNGIMLEDLEGLDYDDPMWDDYLDQFTFDEMNQLFNEGGYRTTAIEEQGVPGTTLLDGPAGLNFLFGDVFDVASYPAELIISSTWNRELAYEVGDAVGQEAAAHGVDAWYAPAVNIHRSPLGGRNFEYFSEDPYVAGIMGAEMTKGAQDNDIIVTMKHFILNEQEINARSGIMVWTDEQAMRELYMQPFEITVKEGDPHGAMSSFIHIGPVWAGGNSDLLEDVLRTEWGFEGLVSTDAVLGSFMDPELALSNGNELMLAMLPSSNVDKVEDAYKENPVTISTGLRDRTHTTLYTIVNYTNAIENEGE